MQGFSGENILYSQNSFFTRYIYFLIHPLQSFKNSRDGPIEEESGRVRAIETATSEIEKFLVRYTVDGESMAGFNIVGMDD